jgi:hypothetical protein
MRHKPLEVAGRVGTLVLALLLLPFLMMAGLVAFLVRALWPGAGRPAAQKVCQTMTGDGFAPPPRPGERYMRWLGRDAG